MMTKAQWDALTAQQQWDHFSLLQSMIDDEPTREVSVSSVWETEDILSPKEVPSISVLPPIEWRSLDYRGLLTVAHSIKPSEIIVGADGTYVPPETVGVYTLVQADTHFVLGTLEAFEVDGKLLFTLHSNPMPEMD